MADDIVTSLREMATDRARHATHYDGCDESHLECAALDACNEIERLRALIIQWDAAFFGRRDVGDWPPKMNLIDAEFALHEEARRGSH